MKKIIIIGSGAFLAGSFIKQLPGLGYKVVGFSRSAPDPDFAPAGKEIEIIARSYTDLAALKPHLQECDTLVHFASASTPANSAQDPVSEITANVLPTIRLLQELQNYRDKHFIYISSAGTVYGNQPPPLHEQLPLQPTSYYGAGKAAIEIFLRAFQLRGNNKVTIVRPTNIYGPGQKLKKNFGLIRTMLEKVKTGDVLEVRGDGTAARDYLHIDDFSAALLSLLQQRDKLADFEVFNVGCGAAFSINRIIEIVRQVTGTAPRVKYVPGQVSDVVVSNPDIGKIMTLLDWRPEIPINDGIRQTWEWLRTQ
ncbi:MAG: NAD-dependent epimerase/dehydratase family protein [Desulfobulbales bacterium]|nr:NAD-dependent epimerase/dehydratase family protein [Desulfobulbales bacterium]